MTRRERAGGLALAVLVGAVAGGAVYLSQRVSCARFPDALVLGAACDWDAGLLAVGLGIAVAAISLAGWFQSHR